MGGAEIRRAFTWSPGPAGSAAAPAQTAGVQPDEVCIGSFQKDGIGQGDGPEPKLVKGVQDLGNGLVMKARKQGAIG